MLAVIPSLIVLFFISLAVFLINKGRRVDKDDVRNAKMVKEEHLFKRNKFEEEEEEEEVKEKIEH